MAEFYQPPAMVPSALYLLRRNITDLLRARHETQKSLAFAVGHDKSWLNKFLNGGRGIQMKELDRIADFFGLAPYQLFQPGITGLTERRGATDRRSGRERRVGHVAREMRNLDAVVAKAHPRRGSREAVAISPSEHLLIEHARQLTPTEFEGLLTMVGAARKKDRRKA